VSKGKGKSKSKRKRNKVASPEDAREAAMVNGRNLRLNCLLLSDCWPDTFPIAPTWCDENDYDALTSFDLIDWFKLNGGTMEVPEMLSRKFGWTLPSALGWLLFGHGSPHVKVKARLRDEFFPKEKLMAEAKSG